MVVVGCEQVPRTVTVLAILHRGEPTRRGGSMAVPHEISEAVQKSGSETRRPLHLLLFRCPKCGDPIVTCRENEYLSLEIVDDMQFTLKCMCSWSGQRRGMSAMRHWVEKWAIALSFVEFVEYAVTRFTELAILIA